MSDIVTMRSRSKCSGALKLKKDVTSMFIGDLLPAPPATRAVIRTRLYALETLLATLVETFGDVMEQVNEMREQLAEDEPATTQTTSES